MTTTAGRFVRYDASTTLSLDLSRRVSLTARYLAQQYDPRAALTAALPLSQHTRGQSLRLGVTLWADALR